MSIRPACVGLLGLSKAAYYQSISSSSSNLLSYKRVYLSLSLSLSPISSHLTHLFVYVCVCVCVQRMQFHPQGTECWVSAQSEHFSHSLLYSLAFTCEHDNKTPFVRRQWIYLAFFPPLFSLFLICVCVPKTRCASVCRNILKGVASLRATRGGNLSTFNYIYPLLYMH